MTVSNKDMFNSVVLNAIDFLKQSVSELKINAKSSVINFYAATELFLKARLIREHWTLTIIRPENVDMNMFLRGDFQSLSLDEAIKKLENNLNQKLTREEIICFRQLKKHRNKVVHFFNPMYSIKPDEKTLYAVISEQCKGWFYLHRLLTDKWKDVFKSFQTKISELDNLMHSHTEYLRAKFDTLKPEIDLDIKKGVIYRDCEACGYNSVKEIVVYEPLYDWKCLVCRKTTSLLIVPCPDCKSEIFVYDLGKGDCVNCGRHISIDYLINEYGPDTSTKEYLEGPQNSHCISCMYPKPTVVFLGEEWLCLFCLEPYTRAIKCERCGEWIAGNLEDSYQFGCMFCRG